jgi:hypothetical protein
VKLSADGSCSTDCPAFVGCQLSQKTMVNLNTWKWFPGPKCVDLPVPVVVQAQRQMNERFGFKDEADMLDRDSER